MAIVAINRINPYLDEVSGYTTAVIQQPNGDRRHTPAEYGDYFEVNADYAADLAPMVANFVDYGNMQLKLERLDDKLEATPYQ